MGSGLRAGGSKPTARPGLTTSSCFPKSRRSMGSKWRTEAARALPEQVGIAQAPGGWGSRRPRGSSDPLPRNTFVFPAALPGQKVEKSEGKGHRVVTSQSGASGGIRGKGSMSQGEPAPSAGRAPVRPGARPQRPAGGLPLLRPGRPVPSVHPCCRGQGRGAGWSQTCCSSDLRAKRRPRHQGGAQSRSPLCCYPRLPPC